MGKTTNIFFLYKISKKEHLKSLAEGKVFFSCCRKYVDITKEGCDKGQGDKYECVFAKYLLENSEEPIRRYKNLFGRDLLIEKREIMYCFAENHHYSYLLRVFIVSTTKQQQLIYKEMIGSVLRE